MDYEEKGGGGGEKSIFASRAMNYTRKNYLIN